MRQQLSQSAVGPGGEFGEDVFEVGPRIVAVELGGFDQAHERGGAFAGLLGAHRSCALLGAAPTGDSVLHLNVAQIAVNCAILWVKCGAVWETAP